MSSVHTATGGQLQRLLQATPNGVLPKDPEIYRGLCGRVIRGLKASDFETLTEDPSRKIVLLMDNDGLYALAEKSGYEILLEIGYNPDYIELKVGQGNQFKLALFPSAAGSLATWQNVAKLVAEIYPDVAFKIDRVLAELNSTSFDEIQKQSGFIYLDVEALGSGDPRYMTYERFQRCSGRLHEVRAFLYFTLHLREQFSGDGYTKTADGKQGVGEYMLRNQPIATLGENLLINLEIQLPQPNSGGMVMQNAASAQRALTTLPLPDFFPESEKNAGKMWQVDYDALDDFSIEWRNRYNIPLAAKPGQKKIVLMPIDAQGSFCFSDFSDPSAPIGELPVGGAVQDNIRLAEFGYRYLHIISEIAVTLDTHMIHQIFHRRFWVDSNGNHPKKNTIISVEDVEQGVWKVNPSVLHILRKTEQGLSMAHLQGFALHYVRSLRDNDQDPLMIWRYHTMFMGMGHCLAPIVEQMVQFHALVRDTNVNIQVKGTNILTECYGALSAEVLTDQNGNPIDQLNVSFLETLLKCDYLIVAGQASSHCVARTMAQLSDQITLRDPSLAKKVYIMWDCMSPVVVPNGPDFTAQALAARDKYEAAGMNIVLSTTPIEQWPGMVLN